MLYWIMRFDDFLRISYVIGFPFPVQQHIKQPTILQKKSKVLNGSDADIEKLKIVENLQTFNPNILLLRNHKI